MTFFKLLFIIPAIIIILYSLRKINPLKIILYALSGVICLISADLIMSSYGSNMPINYFSISVSAAGGIPAVIMLTLMTTFMI